MNIDILNTELYTINHISEKDIDEIADFHIENKKGRGLEAYLKSMALYEEAASKARTYIIRDAKTNQLAAYFTLKTGLISQRTSFISFDNTSAIELANFGANDNYRKYNDVIPQMGKYIFLKFILPLVTEISQYVGCSYLYIFALPQNKLMKHYESMGFSKVENRAAERYIHNHIRPRYDRGCIFMYLKI